MLISKSIADTATTMLSRSTIKNSLLGIFTAIAVCAGIYAIATALQPKDIIGSGTNNAPALTAIKPGTSTEKAGMPNNQPMISDAKPARRPVSLPNNGAYENSVSPQDIDVAKIQETVGGLLSNNEDERREAIELLSKIGTPRQKKIITEYSLDLRQPIATRIAALENIDWEENTEALTGEILQAKDVGASLVYMASSKSLSDKTRASIESAMIDAFSRSQSPNMQLAILTYFGNQNSENFDILAEQIDWSQYIPDETTEAKRLIEIRARDREIQDSNFINDRVH